MNKFVTQDYDKFEQKNVIRFKEEIEAKIKASSLAAVSPRYGF